MEERYNNYQFRSEETHSEVPEGTYTGILSGWVMRVIYNGIEYCWQSATMGIRGTTRTTIVIDKEGHAYCNV